MVRLYLIRYFTITFLFLVGIVNAYSQEDYEDIDTTYKIKLVEFSIGLSSPQALFGEKLMNNGVGLGLAFLIQQKPAGSIFLGADAYWNSFFRTSLFFQQVVDGFLEDLQQKSRTSVAGSDFILRFYPFENLRFMDVYIDGMLGAKAMLTTTTLTVQSTAENLDYDLDNLEYSISYGLGVGGQINIYQYLYFLNFKASYQKGTSAGFFGLPDDIENVNLTINDLEFRNAPIDLIRYQFGVTFAF